MKKTANKKPGISVRMAPKRLSDLRAKANRSKESNETDFEMDAEDDDGRPVAVDRESAVSTLVGAAYDAAVPADVRRRLRHSQALAAIVVVPSAAWVMPVAAHVRAVLGSRWCLQTREGPDRKRDRTVGNADVAQDLSRGMCVMGIAADESLLPSALTTAVDITIRIPHPDGSVLRRAIARFARSWPAELDGSLGAGLDLHQIVAAFRPGTGPTAIVRRLQAAARPGGEKPERLPALSTAIEFGEARLFGLQMATDLAAWRAKSCSWREIDRGIVLASRTPGLGKSTYPRMLGAAIGIKGCTVPVISTSVGSWFATGPGHLHSVIQAMRASHSLAVAAARTSPAGCAIWHLDELDALPNRATLSPEHLEWWNVLIADALSLLDGILSGEDNPKIIVCGTTNFVERIDPALLRPGRLERVVEIGRPDAAGAANILRFHLDGELSGEDLGSMGALLEGSTGAEIMFMVRQARRTARNAGRPLSVEDLERVVLPRDDVPPQRLFRMSVHEAAHAVAALVLEAGAVRQVVLRNDGSAGGRTVIDFGDDPLKTRHGIEDRVVVGLAARAAERIFTGAESTGSGGAADSDIGSSTALVAAIHGSFGMGEDLVFRGAGDDLLRDLAFDAELRGRVAKHLRELEARADRLVAANRGAIRAVAERLAAKRFLTGAEVEGLVRGLLVADPGSRPAATGRRPKTESLKQTKRRTA